MMNPVYYYILGSVIIVTLSLVFGWYFYRSHENQSTWYDEHGRVVASPRPDKSAPSLPTAHDTKNKTN